MSVNVGSTYGFVPRPFTFSTAKVEMVADPKKSLYLVTDLRTGARSITHPLFLFQSVHAPEFEKAIIAIAVDVLERSYSKDDLLFRVYRNPETREIVATDPIPGGYSDFFAALCVAIDYYLEKNPWAVSLRKAWMGDNLEREGRRAYFRHFKQDADRCYSEKYVKTYQWYQDSRFGYCNTYPLAPSKSDAPRTCANIKSWRPVSPDAGGGGDGGGGGGGELDPDHSRKIEDLEARLLRLRVPEAPTTVSASASGERERIAIALPRGGRRKPRGTEPERRRRRRRT